MYDKKLIFFNMSTYKNRNRLERQSVDWGSKGYSWGSTDSGRNPRSVPITGGAQGLYGGKREAEEVSCVEESSLGLDEVRLGLCFTDGPAGRSSGTRLDLCFIDRLVTRSQMFLSLLTLVMLAVWSSLEDTEHRRARHFL